jgi:thiosulfate/3-mercaptopyruvate sulfurtransferase
VNGRRGLHRVREGLALGLLAAVAACASRSASTARPVALPTIDPVVSTEWLQREIGRPDLVILQFGGAESFAKAHIPGAVALDYEREVLAPAAQGSLRVELPSPEALQATLRAKGISPTSRVVIVFDQPASFVRAGRTFFTLEWGGLPGRVAVLDGGLPKWVRESRSVETGTGRRVEPSTSLTLSPATHLKATKSDVVAMIGQTGMRIVDARDAVFYNDERDNQMPRGGHIASAVSLPFSTMTNADGTLRPRAELEQLVRAAGISAEETITTYCHIGVQASWMYLLLRVLDRDVRMYDGSFDEWSRDASLPVEGAKPRP